MVTKVKDRLYFFLSSVFGCLFTSHFKLSLSNLVMMTKKYRLYDTCIYDSWAMQNINFSHLMIYLKAGKLNL